MKNRLTKKEKNSLIRSFISLLTSRGKKSKATSISSNILDQIFFNKKISIKEVITHLKTKLYSLTTSKIIYFRQNTSIVPVPLDKRKRHTAIFARVFKSVNLDKKRDSACVKTFFEVKQLLLDKNPKSLYLKNLEIKEAIYNRSNNRFKW